MIETRVMPNNKDVEKSVLTALLTYNDISHEIVHLLKPAAFYDLTNQAIYSQALELNRKGKIIDINTMLPYFPNDASYVAEIGTSYVSEDLVPQYVETLIDLHSRRDLLTIPNLTNKAYSVANDIDDVLSEVHSKLDNIGVSANDSTVGFDDILNQCIEKHDEARDNGGELSGIGSGYRSLDKLNNGWNAGELIVLAGRPAMGKTTLALNFMLEAIKRDKKVAMFSMEMTSLELGQKMLSILTGVETNRIKLGECTPQEQMLQLERGRAISSSLTVNDEGSMDIHKLKSISKKLKASQGLDMIVVDYLQLLNGTDKAIGGGSREQQVSYLSRSLKALAKDLNIPIICLSQLSRALESREDKRPLLSDLRESGAIEQDANQVIMVFREAYYTKDDTNNVTEVIISKNRSGRCGTAKLEFNGSKSTFTEHREDYDSMV